MTPQQITVNIRHECAKAYGRGYAAAASRRWHAHRPPVPPHEIVAALIEAATKLRDAADNEIAKEGPDENYAESVFGASIDAVDVALKAVTEWLTAQEPPA